MDPFQRYLGITASSGSTSLYRLIGVAEGEMDQAIIKGALQNTGVRLKQADRSADPEGWKLVVEEVKRAQQILLSPEANSKYFTEQQNKTKRKTGTPPVSAPPAITPQPMRSSPSVDPLADIRGLLPVGDPCAALDISLLETAPAAVNNAPWFAAAEVRIQTLAQELAGSFSNPRQISAAGNSVGLASAPSIKKNKARVKSSALSRAMPLVVLFGGALGLLGFGGYMLYSNQSNATLAQGPQPAAPDNARPVDPVMGNPPAANNKAQKPPRRSGLPGLNEEGAPVEQVPELPPVPKTEPNANPNGSNMAQPNGNSPEMPATNPAPTPPANPAPAEPMTPENPDSPESEKPMENEKPTGDLSELMNEEKPEPAPEKPAETEVKPTAAELKQYADAMNLARKSLSSRDIEKFETSLAKAEPLAITANQKKQFARLKTLGDATKRYEEALRNSIAARGAGENIQVKNTVVGWVEGSGDKFKVRVGGSSNAYTTQTAPLGLTNALVDLVMSPDEPLTQLCKASVALQSKKVANRDEVSTWLDAAVAAGLIDGDFRLVVDEPYDAAE